MTANEENPEFFLAEGEPFGRWGVLAGTGCMDFSGSLVARVRGGGTKLTPPAARASLIDTDAGSLVASGNIGTVALATAILLS